MGEVMDFDSFLKQVEHDVLPDEYFAYLQILLENEAELPPLPEHAQQEDLIRSDPANKVLCRMRMPPGMQSLRMEEQALCREIYEVVREGGTSGAKHMDLLSKVEEIRGFMSDWIRAEICRRPDMLHRIRGANIVYLIGGNWYMMVILVEQ